jgi:hypothetical protein
MKIKRGCQQAMIDGEYLSRRDRLGGDLASSAFANFYYPQSNRGAGLVFGNFAIGTAERKRAATIYSLIGTAKLNNLDPESYLREVLTRIAEYPINRIADLLPWKVVTTKEVSA